MTKSADLTALTTADLTTVTGGAGIHPLSPAAGWSPAAQEGWKRAIEANRPWRSLPWPGGR